MLAELSETKGTTTSSKFSVGKKETQIPVNFKSVTQKKYKGNFIQIDENWVPADLPYKKFYEEFLTKEN